MRPLLCLYHNPHRNLFGEWFSMNELEKKWMAAWRRAGPEMERIRRSEIRRADTQKAIQVLDDAFQSALLHQGGDACSGLVEQQRHFARTRR